MKSIAIVVVASVLGLPPGAAAKGWPEPKRVDAQDGTGTFDPAVLGCLAPGERVRVTTAEGRQVEGRWRNLEGGELRLDAPEQRVPVTSVRKLEVRKRAAREGALLFGGLGALTLGALFASVAPLGCESSCRGGESLSAGLGGVLVGGLLGAGVGVVAGGMTPVWAEARPRTTDALPMPSRDDLRRYGLLKSRPVRSAFDPPVPAERLRLTATLSR